MYVYTRIRRKGKQQNLEVPFFLLFNHWVMVVSKNEIEIDANVLRNDVVELYSSDTQNAMICTFRRVNLCSAL